MTNENSETLPTVAISLKVGLDRSPAPAGELPSEPALCTRRKRTLCFCCRRWLIPHHIPMHFPAPWRMDPEPQQGMDGVQNNQRSTAHKKSICVPDSFPHSAEYKLHFSQIKRPWRELKGELYRDFPSSFSPLDFNS